MKSKMIHITNSFVLSRRLSKSMSVFLLLGGVFFSACESKIQFSTPADEECLAKIADGQEVCALKKKQTFTVKDLKDAPLSFLFVLDVSDSMKDDLSRLGRAFEPLMSQITETDWRMLFTTADHGDHYITRSANGEPVFSHQSWRDYTGGQPYFGQFMALEHKGQALSAQQLNKNVPFYQEVFKDSLTRGPFEGCQLAPFCQRPLEQPLRSLNASLERLAENPSLIHPTGPVIAFLITDEDERVEDFPHRTQAPQVMSQFKRLFPGRAFHAFTMVIQDEACYLKQKQYSTNIVYGKEVSALSNLSQGVSLSLCEEDFGAAFEQMSQVLRTLIEKLTLKNNPILPQEIKVEFLKGKKTPWRIDGRNLIFSSPLEPGSQIQVSYYVVDTRPFQESDDKKGKKLAKSPKKALENAQKSDKKRIGG